MQNIPKIKDINEVKLGITIMQEILSAFSLDELKNLTKDQFLSELDVINAYEEDWKEWKDVGIQYAYLYAFEVINEQLNDN